MSKSILITKFLLLISTGIAKEKQKKEKRKRRRNSRKENDYEQENKLKTAMLCHPMSPTC